MTSEEHFVKERLTKFVILKNKIDLLDYDNEKAKKYVQYVEKSLLIMKKIDRIFAINVFVNDYSYYDVHLSKSSFYNKKNRLVKKLILILTDTDYE